MNSKIKIETFEGKDILPYISEIAKLRMQTFKEYPFLYEGNSEYEMQYLEKFSSMENSILVLAFDHNQIIGAATAFPFVKDSPDLQRVFTQAGLDPASYFCLGEAVTKPTYRGRGIGFIFYDKRIKFAKKKNFCKVCFYTVIRDENDPKRPPNYRPLDPMWQKMGFTKHSELVGFISYPEIGDDEETPHPMVFWTRSI